MADSLARKKIGIRSCRTELKSFEDSIRKSQKCKTFYVGGVFTDELKRHMDADRLVQKSFSVIEILQQPEARDEFLREVFHHAVRVV